MEQKHNSNGFNLFVFGVLVGVVVTLLLTTKKGRRILKTLTDQGLEKISSMDDFLGKVSNEVKEDQYVDEDPSVGEAGFEKEKTVKKDDEEVVLSKAEKIEIEEEVVAPKKRRLFKGIRRS